MKIRTANTPKFNAADYLAQNLAKRGNQTGSFSEENYLKLRAQRLAKENDLGKDAPAPVDSTLKETLENAAASGTQPSGVDSFTENYLKLRAQRTQKTVQQPARQTVRKEGPKTASSLGFENSLDSAARQAAIAAQNARQEYEEYAANTRIPMVAGSGYAAAQQDTNSAEYRKLQELKARADDAQKAAEAAAVRQRQEADRQTALAGSGQIAALSDEARSALEVYAAYLSNPLRHAYAPDLGWDNTAQQTAAIQARQKLLDAGLTDKDIANLAETYTRQKNAQSTQARQEAAAKATGENAFLQNVLSVPANLVGGITGGMYALDEAVKRAAGGSQYETLDPNLPGYAPADYASTVRQTTTENIDDGTAMGKAGAIFYGATMSAVDNLARIMATGGSGASLALAGLSSFQDNVRDVTNRGGTPAQAYAMGIATAGLEVLTEKVSLDSLISTKTPQNIVQLLKNAAIQGGIEVTEEELNFAGGLIADAVIMGQNSDYNRAVADLVEGGMTAEEARKQAFNDNLYQAATVAAQSFLSGGMMSGAQGGVQVARSGGFDGVQGEQTSEQPQTLVVPEAPAQPVQEAQQTPDEEMTPARELAEWSLGVLEDLKNRKNQQPVESPAPKVQHPAGAEISSSELFQAITLRESYEDAPSAMQALNDAIDSYISSKGQLISNNLAARILRNPVAVQYLQENTGMVLPGTASGNRRAVKSAVAAIVENAENQQQSQPETVPAVDAAALQAYNQNQNNAPLTAEEGGNYAAGEVADRGNRWVSPLYPGEQAAPGAAAGTGNDRGVRQQRYTAGESGTHVYRRDSEGREVTPETSARLTVPAGGTKQSRLYENTYANASSDAVRNIGEGAKAYDPDVGTYNPVSEEETVRGAANRLRSEADVYAQYQQLLDSDGWTATDNDTAFVILAALQRAGKIEEFTNLARKQRVQATQGGQFIQSFAKYSRTATGAAVEAVDTVEQYQQYSVATRFRKHKEFSQWKKDVQGAIIDMATQIDSVLEGDVDSMRNIIRSLANFRRTTAWFGNTSRLTAIADAMVNKLDFQTAKDIAVAQLSRIPDDFRQRSMGEILKAIRIQNMLSSLTTVNRNLVSNGAMALVDGFSDSTIGVALDHLVSKVTKRREVGADITRSKEFMKAATEAAQMAALCAELDIPMDAQSKYQTGRTRTFSPRAGAVSRFLSAYEKYLKYGLEVTDSFFEGGTEATVRASLQKLGAAANLSEENLDAIARQTAARRTFKDNRKLTRAAQKTKDALNEIGTDDIGLGDFVIPFARVGSNVAHTAIDYSSGGLGGLYEIFALMRDAKEGKPIEPGRQRKAVTDASRGITGLGLISVFAVLASQGVLQVSNDEDWDKRGLEQAEGFTGTQLNLSAALRAMEGKDAGYQTGDLLLGVDFMEPFNAQMMIGYLLSQEESVTDVINAYPGASVSGVAQALLDSPLMTGLSDVVDLVDGAIESAAAQEPSALVDAAGQLLGTTASGFIPAPVRQAAQVIDPFYRDTTGGNVLEKAANQAIAQIPFASMTLPKKYSGLGEEQRRYAEGDELLAFFNTFIAPGKITQASPSEISGYLNELSEATGSVEVYPDYLAPKSFTFDGKTVEVSGQEMTETYQKTYGENIARIYSDLIATEGFTGLSNEMQVTAIKKAKQYATDLARKAVSDYTKDWMKEAAGNEAALIISDIMCAETGLSETRYKAAAAAGMSVDSMKYVADAIGSLKPEEGYSAVRDIQRYEAITQASDLSDEDKEAWLKVYFSDAMDEKLDSAQDMGLTPEMYVAAYRGYLDNNNRKADTVRYFQEHFDMSEEEAQALYDLYKGTK